MEVTATIYVQFQAINSKIYKIAQGGSVINEGLLLASSDSKVTVTSKMPLQTWQMA